MTDDPLHSPELPFTPRPDQPVRLCFVCLGNICRSPLAEGLFIRMARDRGSLDRFEVDSCGTGDWHVGERPDPRAQAVARKHGINLPSLGRQIDPEHDSRHDLLLAMDRSNAHGIVAAGLPEARVRLLLSFDPESEPGAEVPDPYFGGGDGFDRVHAMLMRACAGLLDRCLRG